MLNSSSMNLLQERYKKNTPDQDVSRETVRLQDLVVILVAVEEGDELAIVKFAAQDIKSICKGSRTISY